MGRYTGPRCRLCRREGLKLFLKGERCYTQKCPFEIQDEKKRSQRTTFIGEPPKKFRSRVTQYGIQLREKQKVKRIYGVLETQFKNLFKKAVKMKGVTGENLLTLLERRLDNVVYRIGLATSRAQARQLVSHAHFKVNGRIVKTPSLLVKKGDIIEMRKSLKISQDALSRGIEIPGWIKFDKENLRAEIVELPKREDINYPIDEHLIVELYSK
uniref:Small ribosomal subunit protein uS4 n=1 Tax=candidate division WOR-3 bacterium TaxID=2052148 RepID=A0A7C4YAQ5_UNCW3